MAEGTVVIKRIKKGGHGGHHGGAWKVAYADFVTAMMAFFLLMWLINTTTPEQKRGIADYFAPQSVSQTLSGEGGVLGGKVMGQDSSRAGGATSVMQKNSPPAPQNDAQSLATRKTSEAAASSTQATDAQQNGSSQDGDFAHAAEAIHQSMRDNPELAKLSKQVIVENTPDGLRIQLVDQNGRPMFKDGTDEPMPYTRQLLTAIGQVIDRLPNRVSISGHTQTAGSAGGRNNWQLSSDRANRGRDILGAAGLSDDRIFEVQGKAGAEPLLPEDPNASANRRLSITLLREKPPVPPGQRL